MMFVPDDEYWEIKCFNCLYYDDINMQPECADCINFENFKPSIKEATVHVKHSFASMRCDVCGFLKGCHIYDVDIEKKVICIDCLIKYCYESGKDNIASLPYIEKTESKDNDTTADVLCVM